MTNGDKVECPSLWLHPVHTAGDGVVPQPLHTPSSPALPTTVQALSIMAMDVVQKYPTPSTDSNQQQISKHQIFVGGLGFIVHAPDVCEQGPWQIPLRFSEVANFQIGNRFLVVGLREKSDRQAIQTRCRPFSGMWIIGVDDDDDSFDQPDTSIVNLLSDISAFGAIRSDVTCPIVAGAFAHAPRTKKIVENTDELVDLQVFTDDASTDPAYMPSAEPDLLMNLAPHPNLMFLHARSQEPDPAADNKARLAIMMDCFCAGDLQQHICDNGPLNEWRAAEIVFGLLSALSHLHAQDIVHNDVKSEGIRMKDDGCPVLLEFGTAARLGDTVAMRRRRGTPGYCAPEVLLNLQEHSAKVDAFGAGVVLYFISSGQLPFPGSNAESILRRTVRCRVKLDLPCLDHIGSFMKSLILLLLYKDPKVRVEASAALKSLLKVFGAHLKEQASTASSYSFLDS